MSSKSIIASKSSGVNARYLTLTASNAFPSKIYKVDSMVLPLSAALSTTNTNNVTLYAGTSAAEDKKIGTATVAANATTINFTVLQNAATRLQNESSLYVAADTSVFKPALYQLTVTFRVKELVRYYTSSSSYTLCEVWRYNGSSFVRCDPQYYDGSAWKCCN